MSKTIQMDPLLFELADLQIRQAVEKRAFIPAGGDPAAAAGGAPPGGDPAAMAMDPSMGGMPPGDPAAAAMPPGGGAAPPFDPSALMPMIQQAVQQAMSGMGGAGAAGGAPGMPGQNPVAGPGGKAKIDPGMIYMELGRIRKMMTTFFEHMQWPLPPDILDDSAVAMSVAGQQPQMAPLGGGQAGGQAPPPGLPAMPGTPAVEPIQPAGAGGAGGGQKMASVAEIMAAHSLDQSVAAMELLLSSP